MELQGQTSGGVTVGYQLSGCSCVLHWFGFGWLPCGVQTAAFGAWFVFNCVGLG